MGTISNGVELFYGDLHIVNWCSAQRMYRNDEKSEGWSVRPVFHQYRVAPIPRRGDGMGGWRYGNR